MQGLRNRLTYANVTATIALFAALAGGAYAAGLAPNSVGSRQIAANAAKGKDVKESSFGVVPTAQALEGENEVPITLSQIFDVTGSGAMIGRVDGMTNAATQFANPSGEDTATATESAHLMGTQLSGSEAGDLQVQLLTGTMPAGTTRTITLRAGDDSADMADTVLTCTMEEGDTGCSLEAEAGLSQFDDMLALEITTTGSPSIASMVFGYTITHFE